MIFQGTCVPGRSRSLGVACPHRPPGPALSQLRTRSHARILATKSRLLSLNVQTGQMPGGSCKVAKEPSQHRNVGFVTRGHPGLFWVQVPPFTPHVGDSPLPD